MSEQESLGPIAYDALYDLYPGSNHTPWEQLGEGDGLKVEIEAQAQAVAAHVRAESAARIAALEAEKASLWFAYLELRLDCARRDESLEKDDIEAELNAARAALKGGSK